METELQCTESENTPVFIEQYVNDVIGFSSQYGSDIRISYTAYNITGKPSKYPNYGDFPQAFVMRTYGRWWNLAPSRILPYMRQSVRRVTSQDYIDLEFEQAVYPVEVKVYETYNPGSVVRIWAADSNETWTLLWEGLPQRIGPVSRIFSPRIKRISFPTRVLRLEFHHLHLDYYTELDAVLLVGTKELSCALNKPYDAAKINGKHVGRLVSQIKELNIHNIPRQEEVVNTDATDKKVVPAATGSVKKIIKKGDKISSIVLEKAAKVFDQSVDSMQIFGDYVAGELQSLKK